MRIQGVDLPRDKRIIISLQYLYGIGQTRAQAILEAAGVDPSIRTKDLTEADSAAIRQEINKYRLEADLRREVQMNIKRLQEIGCYRGLRHRYHLPAHGQRTKTNARTRKGPKKTVAGRGRRRGMVKK
jgi:small subunit ribosomal protein S13